MLIGTNPLLRCGGNEWPADLVDLNDDRLDLVDLASFIAPVRHLNTSPGDIEYSARWDLVPGSSFGEQINVADIAALLTGRTGYPPMFGGLRAYNRACTP